MMIEITGGHWQNKGAALMLLTVIRELGTLVDQNGRPPRFCMVPRGDFTDRARLGLWQVFPSRRLRGTWTAAPGLWFHAAAGRLTRKRFCEKYGLVRAGDTDALIDISGSQFSDAWKPDFAHHFALIAGSFRRRGKPVILLPQMFGPFTKPAVAAASRRAVDQSDLVFARDAQSLQHLRGLAGEQAKFRFAPDITIFTEASPVAGNDAGPAYVCIVPNARMTDVGKSEWGESFLTRLELAGRRLVERGVEVRIVIHDTKGGDRALADRLIPAIGGNRCRIVTEADPLRLKAMLGGADFIIAARYHSIVGALSSGVPAIVMGWSHKYQELMSDFGQADMVHSADQPPEHLLSLVEQLLDKKSRDARREALRERRAAMAATNRAMWGLVATQLGLGAASK